MGAQSSEDEKTDEDDLLDMLDDTDNTELPREKYEELGLGDGLFNGKKIKRIVKVQSSDSKTKEGSKKKEGYKEEEGEAGEGMEKDHDIEDVESFHKIKSMKKIKKMTPIDADIADRMRKEVQEGTSESETTKSKNNKEEYNESSSSKQKIDDPDLTDKVTRILKMFNISDLDDIRKAVKISSMRKIKSKTKVTPMGDGIGDSSKFGFDISKYLRDGNDDSDSGEDIKMKIINEPNESSTEIDIEEYISQYNVKRSNADKIEKENEAIKRLDDEIEEISKALVDNARLLDKERDLQEVLGKMMNVQKEKLMKIKEV